MTARIEKVVTSGQFTLDGGSSDVDNNVWLVGDDAEVIVIDAPHDAGAILGAIDGRTVLAIVLTHGHNDHINAAVELGRLTGAEVWFPPADRMLWDAEHDTPPDRELHTGATFTVAGTVLRAVPTPGHTPGSTCLYAEELGAVFTGDTLFAGGPGATGRSYSDFDTIIDSIRDRLLALPAATVVHTGHGDDTTIGAEAPHLDAWIARGS
ncbi:MBL fold metallo-hydrolase [Aeromicrobium ginsengisoli]|uniref:MBL fold metallo-hydrolase n=1 Tax=Aeromicrobium ginsengisoli TaxID=363867 RepID=A0A5M4FCV3_9ACTN|nr:MBL fold metallo-hydrolase [Aeromicrobium ginsengisoli]KAA1395730.1 MBL fold metallo-hydrolase [Aeromicrobium ginsengisoli]